MNSGKQTERAKKTRKKTFGQLSPVSRLILGILGAALLGMVIYLAYYFLYIVGYQGYRKYLKEYSYEAGTAFVAESGSNVPGFELVTSTAFLELYTDRKTADVAVYDKRTGKITYSNPRNPDEDTVANGANKNFLRSQFMLSYYNDDVVSGTWNSYVDSVSKGNFSVEGIENGIRYLYTIGDNTASFEVPLEYRLYEDYLEVTIPAAQIKELGAGYVYRIQLLRYLGATSYEDEGCFVVPNGSGSIIRFNNGKTTAAAYSQYIYDIDPLAATYTTVEPLETARLPICGICREGGSILMSIEDSASNCVLSAQVSGAFNDYNYLYPSFVLRTVDDLKNFGDSATSVLVMEQESYKSDIRVRYTFLEERYEGYAGIANAYRERLIAEGTLQKQEAKSDIPFYYDVIAAVRETGHILGVQYQHSFAMTSFREAEQISNALAGEGITNQVMNLQGWFNGGYDHNAADTVRVPGFLGGKSGLESLNETVRENGGTLYADVAFQKVTAADSGFPYTQVASRYYGSGYAARFGLVNPTTYRNTAGLGYRANIYSALSPKFLPRYVASFIRKTDRLDVDGYSLRDLGNYLISDKKRTGVIEREQAVSIIEGQMAELENTGRRLMTSQANRYAFGYSSDILNAPINDTRYAIVDASVPLYEMIIHGYIGYSTELLNFVNSDDLPKIRLQMIECGASPHYVFTMEEASRMKLTSLNRYYATTFANWAGVAQETYRYVNEALRTVQDAAMVSHEILSEDLRLVTYDNGIRIYINYGNEEQTVDGVTVPALGYVILQ